VADIFDPKDFFTSWKPIHNWLTGTFLGTLVTTVFWKRIADFTGGAWSKAGELWFEHVWNRRKTNRRKSEREKLIQIAKLQQYVTDLRKTIGVMEKRQTRTEHQTNRIQVKLERCQAERTECRSNYAYLITRVSVLEKKLSR